MTMALAAVVASTAVHAQTLDAVATPSAVVADHVEAPKEIALGTMAVRVWATLRDSAGVAPVTRATLVLGKGADQEHIEMRAMDGAFDSPVEEAVCTVDTYTWVRDGAHDWTLSASTAARPAMEVARGTVRVKNRISTPDLVLFDDRGSAHPWLGTGAGGFAPAPTLDCGLPRFRPVLVDADGDRLPDLLCPGTSGAW
jgi:hypothetical protein